MHVRTGAHIEDAISNAIAKASVTVRNIHWFQVTDTRGAVSNGKAMKLGITVEA